MQASPERPLKCPEQVHKTETEQVRFLTHYSLLRSRLTLKHLDKILFTSPPYCLFCKEAPPSALTRLFGHQPHCMTPSISLELKVHHSVSSKCTMLLDRIQVLWRMTETSSLRKKKKQRQFLREKKQAKASETATACYLLSYPFNFTPELMSQTPELTLVPPNCQLLQPSMLSCLLLLEGSP